MHQTFLVKAFLNTEAAPLIFQYSHLFTGCLLRASWVNECKAFHLVYVCQCWVWRPSPLNVVSVGPLIEPDQFTETASRLAQLPHQRDSNNCTLWPLQAWKSHIYVRFKASMAPLNILRMPDFTISSLQFRHKVILEQFGETIDAIHTCINTTTPNCTLIRHIFTARVQTNKKTHAKRL